MGVCLVSDGVLGCSIVCSCGKSAHEQASVFEKCFRHRSLKVEKPIVATLHASLQAAHMAPAACLALSLYQSVRQVNLASVLNLKLRPGQAGFDRLTL